MSHMRSVLTLYFPLFIHSPATSISWQYQGVEIKSRWGNNSQELNYEFFQLVAGGKVLKLRRVTKYSGGTYKCFARNTLGLSWKIGQLTVICMFHTSSANTPS